MDEKTLTALQGSIKKWEAIVAGTGLDAGTINCPLCQEFADKTGDIDDDTWREDGCVGCPVAETVGTHSCGRTPYSDWAAYTWDHRNDGAGVETNHGARHFDYRVFDDKSKDIAQKELDFLRSLLPSAAMHAKEGQDGQTK